MLKFCKTVEGWKKKSKIVKKIFFKLTICKCYAQPLWSALIVHEYMCNEHYTDLCIWDDLEMIISHTKFKLRTPAWPLTYIWRILFYIHTLKMGGSLSKAPRQYTHSDNVRAVRCPLSVFPGHTLLWHYEVSKVKPIGNCKKKKKRKWATNHWWKTKLSHSLKTDRKP